MEFSSLDVKGEANPYSQEDLCSVCMESVGVDGKERSVAKLKCGHLFHLDCIGSSHNSKGIMQCPNCRDIEDGNWYYAAGNSDPEDIPFDDAFHESNLMDMNPYIGVYESHQPFNPLHWCPYDGPYPQMSVPLGELEIAADPGSLVCFVCENASTNYPFIPVNEFRIRSRHPIGYDPAVGYDSDAGALQHMQSDARDSSSSHPAGYNPMVGAFGHMQSNSVGGEVAQDAISRHMRFESIITDLARQELSVQHQRPVPYRVPSGLGVTQRHMDVASPSTVWTEPNAQGHVQRFRYRHNGGAGRTGQMNESSGQFHGGIAPSSGGQDTGIASVPGTNWQGDQGIPWRRVGSSEPHWGSNFPASSGSNTSSYHGTNVLRNPSLRMAPGFPGYSSTMQHDGSRVVDSLFPQSTLRPS